MIDKPTKDEIRRATAARNRAVTALAHAFAIIGLSADRAREFATKRIDDAIVTVEHGLQNIGGR